MNGTDMVEQYFMDVLIISDSYTNFCGSKKAKEKTPRRCLEALISGMSYEMVPGASGNQLLDALKGMRFKDNGHPKAVCVCWMLNDLCNGTEIIEWTPSNHRDTSPELLAHAIRTAFRTAERMISELHEMDVPATLFAVVMHRIWTSNALAVSGSGAIRLP